MFNKDIINEYKKNLTFCTNFWLNDNHGHSGSLLNLEDISKIEQDDVWNNIFIIYKSDLKSTQKFRNHLKELITTKVEKQKNLDISKIKYVYGGKSISCFDFNKDCDLVNWWKSATKNNSGNEHIYKNEEKYLRECFDKNNRLEGVHGFIKRSWHKGLMVSHSDSNHRIGNIANICAHNPTLRIPYIENLTTYQLNQNILDEILKKYSLYIIIEKDQFIKDIFNVMDDICIMQNSFCLELTKKCTRFSLSGLHFEKFNIRIYFIEKSLKNLLLRKYLNLKLHNNKLIKELLKDKA
ncbi:hypothetical protein [Acinetobacter pittii]|uniref:hypothetical protein n=1 Tax=Acinetobacter pittii TaxID=48296 RepID=UPI001900F22E|nr:hypothetical protein [Acinetobacter pittii]MBJ8435044.1 hypothetical protein [Acinetobacter pittii]